MKTHFIFCCNSPCKDRELSKLLDRLGGKAEVRNHREVISGEDRYIFFESINSHPEKIRGLILSDYRVCDHFFLADDVRHYCDSHIR